MKKLNMMPIHQLHQKRLDGEITTKQIAEAIHQRITTVDDELKAFISKDLDFLLENAEKADQKIQNKQQVSALEGMPIAVKDIFTTLKFKTTCGSKMLENFQSPFESTLTKRLLDNGANIFGKCNLDEFAMGSSNENSAFFPSKNPYDLERVPGGSSGGSAVAVAGGMALASFGTDTGGSIRLPASYTSLVGFKPTYGRVSRNGMIAYASSFDQGGPFTHDVFDSALLLNAVCGYDKMDSTSLNVPVPDFTKALGQDIKGMKVGVIKNLDLSECESDIAQNFLDSVELLKQGGAEIVPIEIDNLKHAIATYYILATSEASSNLGRFDGIRYGFRNDESNLDALYKSSRSHGFGKEVKLRILLGTFALSAGYYDAYYLKAQKIQNHFKNYLKKVFDQIDLIVSPVSPVAPFKLGEKLSDPMQMYLIDAYTVPANIAGIPAMSVPAGFTSNKLPIGLQILGGWLQEEKMLRLAHWFESNSNLPHQETVI